MEEKLRRSCLFALLLRLDYEGRAARHLGKSAELLSASKSYEDHARKAEPPTHMSRSHGYHRLFGRTVNDMKE